MAAPDSMGSPRPGGEPILKDVVAYVEVWSSSGVENYSKTFVNQLLGMGAKVSKTFNRNVTHVIFKEGYQSTWDKAQKYGVKLVSVLWVEKCRLAGVRVDESLYPAINTKEGLPSVIKKKRKCMQPKDFIPRTPENDRRLQKKIEKMANELNIQKTAIDNDVPVLLFEADGSLIYSPTAKIKDQCNAMEKRLQEMKDKRENLSPTFSQMLALNSDPSSSGTCLNTSLNTSHSDESISDVLNTSFDDIWRNSENRKHKVESEKCIQKAKADACLSSPISKTASSSLFDRVTPQQSKSNLPVEKRNFQSTLVTEMLTPEKIQFEEISKEIFNDYLSPSLAVGKKQFGKSPGPTNSSEKQLRSLMHLNFPSKVKSRKKRYTSRKLHLDKTENFLELMTSPVKISPASKEAIYDDYFSPTNLKEGNSRNCTFEFKQKLQSPPHLKYQKRVYKNKKKSILENTDFPSVSKKMELILASDNLVEDNRLKKLPNCERNVNLNCSSYSEIPDVKETVECCNEIDSQKRGGNITIDGNKCLYTIDESVLMSECMETEPYDNLVALEGDAKEHLISKKELIIPMNVQKRENINSEMLNSCEKEKQDHNFIFKSDAALKISVKEMENPSRCIQSVESGKVKLDILDEVSEGFKDQKIKSPEEFKKTKKVRKPTRTLVMTSMPSEKQNIIMQVVDKLKDFSFSCNVCESTTHVVAGEPRRTLNVLLGIARGCWIVSYEWVLWSLEFGYWVSEEPYELSDYFPAASICRLQRHLSIGQYQGDLFASQPVMFITAACEPPCAKLRELVQLCGGQVSRSPVTASIYIGPYRGKKQPEIKYLSEKWILDSISQHKICPYENYLMP
ncbi:microcephalin isoform X1 [Antechinus flavipes]|uniref:microcephalin isoform X1 n=1 Tax=Antechinus flavipes TaxID=38775 RepID=UPI00223561ED|nr:microcephalin isoform X1 [Antechinus flavipes]